MKSFILMALSTIIIFLIYQCKNSNYESDYFNPKVTAVHYNDKEFVGSQTCIECHLEIYQEHIQTAHYKTSSKTDKNSLKGNLENGEVKLDLKGVDITLFYENDNYYHKTRSKLPGSKPVVREMDVTIGSGVKGQSFLSWDDDALYQLQASYFSPSNQWINSPNFPETSHMRPVNDQCLKCHVTFARNKDPEGKSNRYIKDAIIYGIDCERCHGPSKDHVVFHRSNPETKKAAYMASFGSYTQQQRLDACAVCHSGLQNVQIKGNPFSFVSGDTLELFSKNYSSYRKNTKLDVHGNQYGLLIQSKCFIESSKMDCTTCHNPHKNQRSDFNHFNQQCISCHELDLKTLQGNNDYHSGSQDCISCHMPNIPSNVMKLSLDPKLKEIPVYIRTHLIGVYNEN